MRLEGSWIAAFEQAFRLCGVQPGDACAVLSQTQTRPELPQLADGGDFFSQLATHWKKHYAGWTAWLLSPDMKLPGLMRLKESRRTPLWNGAIECRLFRFDLTARRAPAEPSA